jgi:tetratricopeptide (TPR) repeat protein
VRLRILVTAVLALAAAGAPAAAGAAASAGDNEDRPPAEAAGNLLDEVRRNRQHLLNAYTDAPPAEPPSVNLDEAVRRLREAVRQPIDAGRPDEQEAVPGTVPAPVAVPEPAPQRPPLSEEQLRLIRERPLKELGDPMALADSLFLGGHLAEAATLYERMLAEADASDGDRAWCIFQAANCKRLSDPDGALGLYERLLVQHPDCLWAEAAKARRTIVQWRRKARPMALLDQARPDDATSTPEGTGP